MKEESLMWRKWLWDNYGNYSGEALRASVSEDFPEGLDVSNIPF